MITVVEPLKPTLSYQFRTVAWTPVHPLLIPSVGVMVISEAISRTSKRYLSRYAVLELNNPDGRQFKLTKPGGENVYFTFYSPLNMDQCTCLGFEAAGYCKHIDAIRKLVDKKHLSSSRRGGYPLTLWSDVEEQATQG
jgi:hypothetical protein